MNRKEAKQIVNDLIDKTYSAPEVRKWDIQIGRNPWFSLGVHLDHRDPSITFHLPGFMIYAGNCKQPGFRFWNNIVPEALERHG